MHTLEAILALFFCVDAWIWLRLDRLLRATHRPSLWRVMLALSMLSVMVCAAYSLLHRSMMTTEHREIPQWAPAAVYIWHFLIMPLTALALLIGIMTGGIKRTVDRLRSRPPADPVAAAPEAPLWSRRSLLAATAFALPPLATAGLTSIAMGQLGKFRIRRFDLPLAGWPRELDGFTITVIADVHLGVFSTPQMPHDIIEANNALRPDLVLLPGDLINISLSDLPTGLDMVRKLDARFGVFMVQGNHDVIQGVERFNRMCRSYSVPLLIDQAVTLRPRGVPFQLLGTRWTYSQRDMNRAANKVSDLRDPSLFPIMMAHHPHTWDPAAQRGIPLVISGHTHGGQIMLTDHIGGGPLRFKYWSGIYQKPGSTLVVSNGVGDWFPLRVNAPAEILHLTLHSAH
jgi:predicted MPP superfamily phosphohydrolase